MPASETDKLILQRLDRMEETQEKILYCLEGNGTPGLKIRIDRLEVDAERRKWFARASIGASLSALFGLVVTVIRSFH